MLKMDEYPFYLLLGNWKLNHDVLVTVNGTLVLCPISLTKVSVDVLLEVISFGVFFYFLVFLDLKMLKSCCKPLILSPCYHYVGYSHLHMGVF